MSLAGCQGGGTVQAPTEPITNLATSTEAVNAANWQTYKNEEYGIEFKYPKEWIIMRNDYRKNITFNEPVGFSLPNVWYIEFDTGIVRDNRHVPIHIFFEDCSVVGTGCRYNLNEPIYQNNDLYIFEDEQGGGRMWDIAQIVYVDNSINVKKMFGFEYIYDFGEGIGYRDYIGLEIREKLNKLLFTVIKTIKFN